MKNSKANNETSLFISQHFITIIIIILILTLSAANSWRYVAEDSIEMTIHCLIHSLMPPKTKWAWSKLIVMTTELQLKSYE